MNSPYHECRAHRARELERQLHAQRLLQDPRSARFVTMGIYLKATGALTVYGLYQGPLKTHAVFEKPHGIKRAPEIVTDWRDGCILVWDVRVP
ncbi:WD repeat-containing protein 92 [Phytophthora cinnamomi]|uniref:WD repeat-containing protein 92 n=1 Tax=Phytophthora cinnamomi TaxID=4785 RepID=UPI0035598251|nr:WD repeat-containing protein 92 [Phytophthora cinnamomi]